MKFEYQGQPVTFAPEVRKYMKQIEKKLPLPKKVKKSVLSDLVTGMLARVEAGESMDQVMASMGTPLEVAEGIKEEMEDLTYAKNPWRWACLGLTVVCALILVGNLIHGLIEYQAISTIGGADGPMQIFITTSPAGHIHYIIISVILMMIGILGFVMLSRSHEKQK